MKGRGTLYDDGMTTLPLACTVRDCGERLARQGSTLRCVRGHSYDIARSGYVNLLQPQDRRSFTAGDSRVIVEARAALLGSGIGAGVMQAFVREAARVEMPDAAAVVELGAGSGDALAALAAMRRITGVGIDLSRAAATLSARRFPALTWVVANADRRLPIVDEGVALVLSLHARRNPAECRRVLPRDGWLLVAIPAPDDLVELRTLVLGEGIARDRGAALVEEHAAHFLLHSRSSARERHLLDREALLHLLRGTYRGVRASESERVAGLDRLEVTLASEFFLFAPRPDPPSAQSA
jgi:23S rRNA (guanine745-N1)-methyltransferase